MTLASTTSEDKDAVKKLKIVGLVGIFSLMTESCVVFAVSAKANSARFLKLTHLNKVLKNMKKILYTVSAGLGLFSLLSGNVHAAGDAVHGQELYQKMCIACHSIEYNGVGPAHKGVFNQKAGSRADYNYSPAVKASKVVWNDKNLDKWLANPEKFIPGQKMGFMVASAKDRADLIAYLKSDAVK